MTPPPQSLFYLEYLFFLGYLGWGRLAKGWLLSANTSRAKGAGAGEIGVTGGAEAVVSKEE